MSMRDEMATSQLLDASAPVDAQVVTLRLAPRLAPR
jgi:hypothetical protein